jgi:hypothetical protein
MISTDQSGTRDIPEARLSGTPPQRAQEPVTEALMPATTRPASALDSAVRRILSEIDDGLRHGYFDFALTCEITGNGRRRLTLRAGKNYQFLIPTDDCDGRVFG